MRRGGRKKGTPNRKTKLVEEICAEMGIDPIRGLARIAKNPKNPVEIRLRAYSCIAEYMYPKRKAIEHTGSNGEALRIELVYADDPHTTAKTARSAEVSYRTGSAV